MGLSTSTTAKLTHHQAVKLGRFKCTDLVSAARSKNKKAVPMPCRALATERNQRN